jgi:hypothetical protein
MVQSVTEVYENVRRAGTEHAAQNAETREVPKEKQNIMTAEGIKTRGRKRKSAASGKHSAALQAKTVQTRDLQDVSGVKSTKVSNMFPLPLSTETLAEDRVAIDSWRAPVARMW